MKYRNCTLSGKTMTEGYVILNGEYYAKDEKNLLKIIRSFAYVEYIDLTDKLLLENAYTDEVYYWTNWND